MRALSPASRRMPSPEEVLAGENYLVGRFRFSREEAEDCVGDAIVRALSTGSPWRGEGQGMYKTWFLRVVITSGLMRLRKQREEGQRAGGRVLSLDGEEVSSARLPACPARQVREVLLGEVWAKAEAVLSKKSLRVLRLHYQEGWSSEEIAARLRLNMSTVKGRIWRAVGKLGAARTRI